jgi:excinuclease ABC subunit C
MSRQAQHPWPDELLGKLKLLPDAPGVYLHKDRLGKVIYVGKAKRLATRVRSYFQPGGEPDRKTGQLVRQVRDFDYIVTASENEALVLENQLIKEYRPRYNIRLKDDKQYPYIRITLQEPFPRVEVVRRIQDDGARYFGPFTDVRAMRDALKFASGTFQVRSCHLDLPEQTVPRPCLDYQIGRCSAPCVGFDGAAPYRRRVRQLVLFLEGADQRLLVSLQQEMDRLARRLRYEEAARVRDRLRRVERTVAGSRSVTGLVGDLDACAVVRDGREACGVVLRIRRGRVLTSHHFLLQDRLANETAAFLAQLLREYYVRAGDLPREILLSHDLPDKPAWEHWLAQRGRGRVRLVRPRRGPKLGALEMALANATFKLREHALPGGAGRGRKLQRADVALQEALGLYTVPATIECFDISNFQGRESVGSLVFFRDGAPLKSRYRRFRIRRVEGVDDYAMMREVLDRYYGRLSASAESPADLVMVDGGPGQLSVARDVLRQYGFHATELIGLAKREEQIHREHNQAPLELPRSSPALQLLQRVRNEAHRFAITYHRLLRDQRTTASELDRIPGIGKVKKLSLLHHFGSVAEIRHADRNALMAVRGLTSHDVERILGFFAVEHET